VLTWDNALVYQLCYLGSVPVLGLLAVLQGWRYNISNAMMAHETFLVFGGRGVLVGGW